MTKRGLESLAAEILVRAGDGQPARPRGLVDGVAAALGGAGGTVALPLVLRRSRNADVGVAGELEAHAVAAAAEPVVAWRHSR